MSYTYPTLDAAKQAVKAIGNEIREHGTPKDFSPMIFTFTGNGNVATVIVLSLIYSFVLSNQRNHLNFFFLKK